MGYSFKKIYKNMFTAKTRILVYGIPFFLPKSLRQNEQITL